MDRIIKVYSEEDKKYHKVFCPKNTSPICALKTYFKTKNMRYIGGSFLKNEKAVFKMDGGTIYCEAKYI